MHHVLRLALLLSAAVPCACQREPPFTLRATRFDGTARVTSTWVEEGDIEAYDWDDHAIVLTPSASRRFEAGRDSFIAELGGKRLYEGVVVPALGAMAVEHPVIHVHRIEDRAVLVIEPSFTFYRAKEGDARWAAVALPEIRGHFEHNRKLTRPRSAGRFARVRAAVHRVEHASIRTTDRAVEAEIVLRGQRAGRYEVITGISLVQGISRISMLPETKAEVRTEPGVVRRTETFSYEALAETYRVHRRTERDPTQPLAWRLRVQVRPVLDASEREAIGLVERGRLEGEDLGGSVLVEDASAECPVDRRPLDGG